jgi:exopolysaccharide biosynthesis polyprenyl glycosylphosphotransferase
LYHLIPVTKQLTGWNTRILIYGAGELGQALFRSIENSPRSNINPIGFIDDDPNKIGNACHRNGFKTDHCIRVIGNREDIESIAIQNTIEEVWIAISNIDNSKLIEIIDYLKSIGIKSSFIPNLYRVFIHKVSISKVGDLPLVSEIEHDKNLYLVVKKYFDYILSSIAIIAFSFFFLLISIAIKIDSKGPVMFKQDRVGKDGKKFKIFKFRTMREDSEPYAINPIDFTDSRITRVGKFLRKTSLDELPQLINILKGEMSLVGPRPEMPFIVEKYTDFQKERLRVLPGISGLWQLSGDRKRMIHENLDYDLYYIRNMSFSLDIAILIESVLFSFRGV